MLRSLNVQSRDESLHRNPDCDCNACQLTPRLDLKFVAHYGAFAQQEHGPYVELVGSDVNLVHRLLKNRIIEETGIRAYAYITDACAEAMSLGRLAEDMVRHAETYEHLGTVEGYVHNLNHIMARERAKRKVLVERDEATVQWEFDLPLPPSLAWDYLTAPEYQRRWRLNDNIVVQRIAKGRMGLGSLVKDIRGNYSEADEIVVDWSPVDYCTYECLMPTAGATRFRHLFTTEMMPTETGTRISLRLGQPSAENPRLTWLIRLVWHLVGKRSLRRRFKMLEKVTRQMIEADLAADEVKEARPQMAAAALRAD